MMELFDYQKKMLGALRAGFNSGHFAQMLYAPCGAGKTECAIAMMTAVAERGKKAVMLTDLTDLCKQTSRRLASYGIDHGVIQPESTRWRPEQNIQIAMIQTLEARGSWPHADLLIIDEAHTVRKSVVDYIRRHPKTEVVGLSGSPFTKGLGEIYTNVISKVTVNMLAEIDRLIIPRIFLSKEIDMTGAKKAAGEWTNKEVEERGSKIVGDIVTEWQEKTREVFGGPVKTIAFCAGIAHGEDLARKFSEAGHNFIALSHRSDPDFRADVIAEFAKSDSSVTGLIATDLLTKGFDVADVSAMISARPFSKSFSSHVQQLGRIMRVHNAKESSILLDHSGNFFRFIGKWDELCQNGVTELHDGLEKTAKEPTKEEKEAAKCPKCSAFWPRNTDTCLHCGYVRLRKNTVSEVAGEMFEFTSGLRKKKDQHDSATRERWYQMMRGYCRDYGKKEGSAWHWYQHKYGVKPAWKNIATTPSPEVSNYCKSRIIAFAKGKK